MSQPPWAGSIAAVSESANPPTGHLMKGGALDKSLRRFGRLPVSGLRRTYWLLDCIVREPNASARPRVIEKTLLKLEPGARSEFWSDPSRRPPFEPLDASPEAMWPESSRAEPKQAGNG